MAGWPASAILALVLAAPAAAQAPPTPLLTPPRPAAPAAAPESGPPVRIPPAIGTPPTPLPQERGRTAPSPAVTARPLPALDHESAGWSQAEGGLGPDLWRGSAWTAAAPLLERLSAPAGTPARHALARRLLMSAAARPDGAPAGAFLERRLVRLLAVGDAAAAAALARAVPEARLDGPRARPAAEAALLGGSAADACRRARRADVDMADLFWRRLLVACDAIEGHGDRVRLGLDLLRDQGLDAGEAFTRLAEAAAGLGDKPATAAGLAAVEVALAIHAGVPAEPKALAAAPPAVAAAFARASALPPGVRLVAAEAAAGLGLVEPAVLAGLYAELPLPPERLADALSAAGGMPGADGRALLFQAARLEIVPGRRLERLAAGWDHAREHGAALAFGAAAAPLVREMSPSVDLAPHAAAAIRIALAAGDGRTAMRWLAMIGQRPGDAGAMAAHAAAAPLVRLALGEDGPAWNAEAAHRWTGAMGGPGSPRAAVGLALLAALGDLAASDEWIALIEAPPGRTAALPGAAAAVWFAQEAAARESRLGEQVALALLAVGRDAVPHPLAAFSALNGLRLAEQTGTARRIAVEIALLAGL
ncbi:hypothetical protein [Stella sp.]|uniref:hypothetical protein n=1 Tax=Stella sp. TaxID=2912054 RepID=UPI0035ADD9F3